MSKSAPRPLILAASALCFATLASNAAAERPRTTASESSPTAASYSGVTVAIDPVTGRLRQPSAAEIAQLRHTLGVSAQRHASLRPQTQAQAVGGMRRLRNGALAIQLPESQMSTLVATGHADGSVRISHRQPVAQIGTEDAGAENDHD